MNVLLLTYYFAPDLSAGSFRNTPLAHELARQLQASGSVHVLTTQPNRYGSFQAEAASTEMHDNLRVDRITVPPHKGRFWGQLYAYACYVWGVLRRVRGQRYDVVVASSSRLFSGFLGACLARRQHIPLILDIRDLLRENLIQLETNPVKRLPMRPILRWVEWYTFGAARHINLVSEGFRDYFAAYQQATYSYHTNGIDELFLQQPLSCYSAAPGQIRTILYAGNIGEGQGLEKIIPEAAQRLGEAYRFIVIGDGGTKARLIQAVEERQLTNVAVRPPVARRALPDAYAQADYLLMHLNDLQTFEQCIPSKLFEYGATDKPILAGVAGFAAQFVRQHVPNSLLFAPGDAAGLVRLLQTTAYQTEVRTEFIGQFTRRAIIGQLAGQVLRSAGHQTPAETQPAVLQ